MLSKLIFGTNFILVIIILGLISCGQNQEEEYEPTDQMMKEDTATTTEATAQLNPTQGNDVTGTVTFTKVDNGIKVVADIEGLTPGKHGFHIHENGDCSAPDASSAGGHFNPEGVNHGGPTDSVRHVGDMGNIEADNDGNAHFEWIDPLMSFEGTHNIIGKAVIVHSGADDLKSQPSGDAGSRLACGVIEKR